MKPLSIAIRKDLELSGAAKASRSVLNKIRRMLKESKSQGFDNAVLLILEAWVLDRAKRYNRRKGGLQSREQKEGKCNA